MPAIWETLQAMGQEQLSSTALVSQTGTATLTGYLFALDTQPSLLTLTVTNTAATFGALYLAATGNALPASAYGFQCDAVAGNAIWVAPTIPGSWSASTATGYGVGALVDLGGVPGSFRPGNTAAVVVPSTGKGALQTVTVDPTTGVGQAITSFHAGDDQNVSSASGSALASGVAMLQNIAGTADNQRGTGADNSPSIGIATGTTNPKNVGVTTLTNGSGINIGATSCTVALTSATVNGVKWTAKVGSVITFEPDTSNEESFRIQTVIGSTITFKGPSGASSCAFAHALGSVVTFDTYNVERDASGENDGGRGKGFVVAVDQMYNGGAANGAQNYERARFLQGEKAVFTYLSSAATAGAFSIVLNSVTGLLPGVGIDIEDGVGGNERVFVREDYVPGNTTVPLRTALLFSHAAGNSSTTTATTNKSAIITLPSTANLANGQMVIIEPGTANMEIGFVSSFSANTSITLTATTVRNHASGVTVIWGCCDYDAFDVWGPQSGPLGTGAEEVELMAQWDQPSRSPRLLNTASTDAMNPSNVLGVAPMLYTNATDSFSRILSSSSVNDGNGSALLPTANMVYNGTTWDRLRGDASATGVALVSNSGNLAAYIAAATAGNTVIKASKGKLMRVIVTTLGTAAMSFYDNSTTNSGNILFTIPASAPVGSIYDVQMPATAGITAGGSATNPGVSIAYH